MQASVTCSNPQVAEVIGTIIARPDLAENKCLEVVAETTAPLTDMESLLDGVAQEVGQQERIVANAAVAAARDKVGVFGCKMLMVHWLHSCAIAVVELVV